MYLTQPKLTLLYSELLAAALRYRYPTSKVFTSSTDINNKIKLLWCGHLARTKCTSLNLNLPYYIANCLQQRFAIVILLKKLFPVPCQLSPVT
ncbi:hypothetical protein, partial [Dolichospermum planctonicum]|uniref:hypothetical protein n=1 Tax=Dolichospermum planctonicum TaxID=136072 RepID=UPI001F17477B